MSTLSRTNFRMQMSGLAMTVVGTSAVLAIVLFFYGLLAGNAGLVYASVAIFAFLMPATVGLMRGREYDIFEPINFVTLGVFLASSLKAFYLLLSDTERSQFNMWSTSFDAVLMNLPWIMGGMVALVVGYLFTPYRLPLESLRFVREYQIGRKWLWISLGTAAFAGALGTIIYMRQHGIDLSANILAQSKKRVFEIESESGDTMYAMGVAGFLARYSQFGLLLLGGVLIARLMRPTVGLLAILAGLFLLSSLVPFFSSSRSAIIQMFIFLLIIGYYYGRIRLRTIMIALAAACVIVAGMGYLRSMNQTGRANSETAADAILGNGNGLDFVRTSSIMDRVPEVRPYQYGRSYLALFSAPIPRSTWPEKPDLSMGGWVKKELYGHNVRKHGWPPAMIAEAYINFGRPGIFVVMLLFGAFLRIFYESFRPFLGVSLPMTMLYAVTVGRLSGSVGLNLSLGIFQALQLFLPMLFFLWLAKAPRLRKSRLWLAGRPAEASA